MAETLTVSQAREILGSEASRLTDQQVRARIEQWMIVARAVFDALRKAA